MTFKISALILSISVLMAACSGSAENNTPEADGGDTIEQLAIAYVSDDTEYAESNEQGFYGETFEDYESTETVNDLVSSLEASENVATTIKGTCSAICEKKGCWLTLQEGDQEVFVNFKDYGFFLPRDIEGKEIILKGEGYYEMVSVDDLKHYAEDEGKSQEEIDAITEPEQELYFTATGALVLNDSNSE